MGLPPVEPVEHLATIVQALTRGLNTMRALDPESVSDDVFRSAMSFMARALTPPGG